MNIFGESTSPSIAETGEVQRIRALQRNVWTEAQLQELALEMTKRLKTPEGTQTLRPKQALALYYLYLLGGLVGKIRVGGGKTLVTMLAPMVLNPRPDRPFLLLPASLIDKTERDREEYSKHWKIATHQRFYSYDMLSRVGSADLLETYKPDFLGLDEAHRAKNRRAGVTKRLVRYMQQNPTTRAMVLSGTLAQKGLDDMAHLVRWALKDGAPVPRTQGETDEWADALDEDVNPLKRLRPGALLSFGGFDLDASEEVQGRQAFRGRFISTPGVVSTDGEQVACSLNITAVTYPESATTNEHLAKLRDTWTTPDGWTFSEAVKAWRHARELALGYHGVWDPRPPTEWLNARREWAAYCRDILSNSRHLDTELQVKMAVESGELDDLGLLRAWEKVQPTFTVQPKPIWHDTSALEFCQKWMKHNNGLVWVEHVFFGQELARRSGVDYYGEGGLTEDGRSILDLERSEDAGKRPAILSIGSNATGRNLQAWNKNLLTTGIGRATKLEQLIGRTHRDGQKGDEVSVDIMLGCWETWFAWQTANAQSIASRDTYGEDFKLLIATSQFPDEETIKAWSKGNARWRKQGLKPTDGTVAAIWKDDDDED